MKRILSLTSIFAIIIAVVISANSPVSAAFNKNHLIDDGLFTATNSMTVAEIQSFLESQGSLLANWRDNVTMRRPSDNCVVHHPTNMTAAQIIHEAATAWGAQVYDSNGCAINGHYWDGPNYSNYTLKTVSPKVLLVTLQKEQSLLSANGGYSTDPNAYKSPACCSSNEYKLARAMGYGVPDSGGINEKYLGFYNQIMWAAWQLRFNYERSGGNTDWDGVGYITYAGPMIAGTHRRCSSCAPQVFDGYYPIDGQNLYMDNRATASLYYYTPHTYPGFFGNFNFVNFYEQWFGPVTLFPLFRLGNSFAVYYQAEGRYYKFADLDALKAYGFSQGQVKSVASNYTQGLSQGPNLTRIARYDSGNPIYLVDNGQRYHFPDQTVLNNYGYTTGNAVNYPAELEDDFPLNSTSLEEIVIASNNRKFLMDSGKKRRIMDDAWTTQGSPVYSTRANVNLSSTYTSTVPYGAPIMSDEVFVKSQGGTHTYIYQNSTLHKISSGAESDWGNPAHSYTLESGEINSLTSGQEVGSLVKKESGDYRFLQNGVLDDIDASVRSDYGLVDGDFTTVNDALISSFTESGTNINLVIKVRNTNPIYLADGGSLYHVASGTDYTALGYTGADAVKINANDFAKMSVSSDKIYAPGAVIQGTGTNPVYFVDSMFNLKKFPSLQILKDQYGLRSATRKVPANSFSGYTMGSDMSMYLNDGADNYLVNGHYLRKFSAALHGPTEFNLGGEPHTTLTTELAADLFTGSDMKELFRGSGNAIYAIENGQKRKFTSKTALDNYPATFSDVVTVSDYFISTFPDGAPIN